MQGHVDDYGRAIITFPIRPSDIAAAREISAWIDTGFNGEYPFLDVGLLVYHDLQISYRSGEVTID